jgi:hypothetical protein
LRRQAGARKLFVATGDDNELLFQKLLYGVVRAHTPNGFDLTLGHRLLVRDDGQCFESRRGKALQEFFSIQLRHRLMKIFLGQELPAAAAFAHFEGIEFGIVFFDNAFQGRVHLAGRDLVFHEPERPVDQVGHFRRRERFVGGEDKGFNMRNET